MRSMVEENMCVGDKCMAPHDDGGVAMDDETLLNNKNNIVTRVVVLCFCLGLVCALVYYIKQTQRQKLLKENAEMELLMVKERNLQAKVRAEQKNTQQPIRKLSSTRNSESNVASAIITVTDAFLSDEEEEQPIAATIIANPMLEKKVLPPQSPTAKHNISNVRAKQQAELVSKTKSKQREKQREKKKSIIDNKSADEAYERRMKVIAEERQQLLISRGGGGRGSHRQQPRQQQQEMERTALVQAQNLEYQQALQRDRERAQRLALENEVKLKRVKAIEAAKQRLGAAPVQSSDIGIPNQSNGGMICDRNDEIKVRLLLPSGCRVEGTFSSQQCMGLVYDLALLVLNKEQSLWKKQEQEQEEDYCSDEEEDDDSIDGDNGNSASSDLEGNDYNDIQKEWGEIFYPFSIVSRFPQQTYDELDTTLKDCGLSKSAMLMVVVEID